MTWKSGDTVALVAYLESAAGAPQVYANYAAFVAAGWALTFYSASTPLGTQPTIIMTAIGTAGLHSVSFILPAGVDSLIFIPPAGMRSDPAFQMLIVPGQDTDSLAASIAAVVGGPAVATGATAFDFTSIEQDNFIPQQFTVPLTALQVLDTATKTVVQYVDLSDIGGQPWTIAASARGSWNRLPASGVTFSYSPVITDKVNRRIALGFGISVPAGAVVLNADGSADTTGAQVSSTFQYDIQLQPPVGSTYAGIRLTVVTGNHTILRQQTTSP